MNNFIFENKTKVYFGKGGVKEYLGCLLDHYGDTVMLAYGGGSIKRNGVYDQVMSILNVKGKRVVEFSGIMPNPTYAKVQEGARLARENHVDLILAVGGGSVSDCCKVDLRTAAKLRRRTSGRSAVRKAYLPPRSSFPSVRSSRSFGHRQRDATTARSSPMRKRRSRPAATVGGSGRNLLCWILRTPCQRPHEARSFPAAFDIAELCPWRPTSASRTRTICLRRHQWRPLCAASSATFGFC